MIRTNNKNELFLRIMLTLCCLTTSMQPSEYSYYRKFLNRCLRTKLGFHLTSFGFKIRYGSIFTHDMIMNPQDNNLDTAVTYDSNGAISAIHDGKKSAIVLGTIPRSVDHINTIATIINPAAEHISLYSMTEDWENESAGLHKLVKKDHKLKQYKYQTPDFTPPSIKNIVQAVYDLSQRDAQQCDIAYIHCKAGVGRGPTITAAYLLYVLHKAGNSAELSEIITYMQTKRPKVDLSSGQEQAVLQFYKELKKAGSLKRLCKKYKVKTL